MILWKIRKCSVFKCFREGDNNFPHNLLNSFPVGGKIIKPLPETYLIFVVNFLTLERWYHIVIEDHY